MANTKRLAGDTIKVGGLKVTGTATVATLDVTTPKIGGVAVGSTAAEIDSMCDVSAYTQAITVAGAITVDGTKRYVTLSGASGAYAITLAAPGAAMVGKTLTICYLAGSTNAITLALTNVVGGSAATTASFDAVSETLVLMGTTAKWVVMKESGVTLS